MKLEEKRLKQLEKMKKSFDEGCYKNKTMAFIRNDSKTNFVTWGILRRTNVIQQDVNTKEVTWSKYVPVTMKFIKKLVEMEQKEWDKYQQNSNKQQVTKKILEPKVQKTKPRGNFTSLEEKKLNRLTQFEAIKKLCDEGKALHTKNIESVSNGVVRSILCKHEVLIKANKSEGWKWNPKFKLNDELVELYMNWEKSDDARIKTPYIPGKRKMSFIAEPPIEKYIPRKPVQGKKPGAMTDKDMPINIANKEAILKDLKENDFVLDDKGKIIGFKETKKPVKNFSFLWGLIKFEW